MDLLKQVVLLLTHDKIVIRGVFLALFELILEVLSINSDTAIADDLLPSIGRNGSSPTGSCELAHPLDA